MTNFLKPEKDKLFDLIKQGYKIELINPYGKSFKEKYRVYESFGWNKLKIIQVDNNGNKVIPL